MGLFTDISVNTTAVASDKLAVTANAITITLPISPAESTEVEWMDAGAGFGTNNLTIARNGETIMGLAEDMVVSDDNASAGILFINGDWRLF